MLAGDETALHSFCARILGWEAREVIVEHAIRSIELAVDHSAALVLLGETDLERRFQRLFDLSHCTSCTTIIGWMPADSIHEQIGSAAVGWAACTGDARQATRAPMRFSARSRGWFLGYTVAMVAGLLPIFDPTPSSVAEIVSRLPAHERARIEWFPQTLRGAFIDPLTRASRDEFLCGSTSSPWTRPGRYSSW